MDRSMMKQANMTLYVPMNYVITVFILNAIGMKILILIYHPSSRTSLNIFKRSYNRAKPP